MCVCSNVIKRILTLWINRRNENRIKEVLVLIIHILLYSIPKTGLKEGAESHLFPLDLCALSALLVGQADLVALNGTVDSVQNSQELRLETICEANKQHKHELDSCCVKTRLFHISQIN